GTHDAQLPLGQSDELTPCGLPPVAVPFLGLQSLRGDLMGVQRAQGCLDQRAMEAGCPEGGDGLVRVVLHLRERLAEVSCAQGVEGIFRRSEVCGSPARSEEQET